MRLNIEEELPKQDRRIILTTSTFKKPCLIGLASLAAGVILVILALLISYNHKMAITLLSFTPFVIVLSFAILFGGALIKIALKTYGHAIDDRDFLRLAILILNFIIGLILTNIIGEVCNIHLPDEWSDFSLGLVEIIFSVAAGYLYSWLLRLILQKIVRFV